MTPAKILIALFIIVINPFIAHSQNRNTWVPKLVPIQTRWAKDVSPQNALKEYPRPQMVRSQWMNLNGTWDYSVTSKEEQFPSKYQGKILVPFPIESSLSGVKKAISPDECLWYRRIIETPKKAGQDRVLLHFGAVDWRADVYLNGTLISKHTGGYDRFTIDITSYLKTNKNELVVRVYDPTDRGINPHGKQVLNPENIYYTSTTGIWQTVWLETVPETFIASLELTPNIDAKNLALKVNLNKYEEDYEMQAVVFNGSLALDSITGKPNNIIRLDINNMHLWSPADPFLYDLVVRVLHNGRIIDEVKSYFGMRKISIIKDGDGIERFALNGKSLYNLGVLDQGFWPDGLYTAPTDEALAFDIEAIKAMGFNTIRKHIKVEPDRWYFHCDRLGMLVWQDFVNPPHQLPEGAKKQFENEVAATINQLYNHPCVSTWVLFNEKWGAYDQKRLANWVKSMDPSRLVNAHSGEMLYVDNVLRSPSKDPYVGSDFTDVHSYPNPRISMSLPGKVKVLGEFGGIGVFVPEHQWSSNGWGYVNKKPTDVKSQYLMMTQQLMGLKAEGLSGSIYTQPFDVEDEQNGLITYDREIIKIPLDTLQNINSLLNPESVAKMKVDIANMDLTDANTIYKRELQAFQQGERNPKHLKRLSVYARQFKDEHTAKSAAESVLKSIKGSIDYNDLNFLQQFCTSTNDYCFNFIIKNTSAIKELGAAGKTTLERATDAIINKVLMDEAGKNHTNIESLIKQYRKTYGEIGEFGLLEGLTLSYLKNKDVPKYINIREVMIQLHPERINNWAMAYDSWFVFENAKVSDKASLQKGLQWSAKVLESEPNNAPNIDTYANILYKLGKRSDALIWQEKALKIEPGRKELITNYEKMKKGIPTWE